MKIKRNIEKEEKICKMQSGTVFLSGNILYMKTDSITIDDKEAFNAVTLETGKFDWFNDNCLVHPCYDAELLIP